MFLLVLATLANGCVAFPAYPIRQERESVAVAPRPGGYASVEVAILRYVNDRPRKVPDKQQADWRQAVAHAYRDLDVFDRLGPVSPDVSVQVEIRDFGGANRPLVVLSALTLFLVPAWSTSDFVVTTRISRFGSAPIAESSVRYSYRSYYHLLLLPLVPTHQELTVEREVIYGLARKGLAEALASAKLGPGVPF